MANQPDDHSGPQFIHLQNGLVVGNQTRKTQRSFLGFQLHCEVDSQWVLVLPPVSRCSPRKGSWEAQGDVWGLEELPPVPCNSPVQVEVLLHWKSLLGLVQPTSMRAAGPPRFGRKWAEV